MHRRFLHYCTCQRDYKLAYAILVNTMRHTFRHYIVAHKTVADPGLSKGGGYQAP